MAKQLQGGVECILGIHRDPVFGPIAMFGLGGIFVEVMKDVVFRRCPFGDGRGGADDPLDQGRAAAAGRARASRPTSRRLPHMLARLSAFAAAAGPRLHRSTSTRCSPCRKDKARSRWTR